MSETFDTLSAGSRRSENGITESDVEQAVVLHGRQFMRAAIFGSSTPLARKEQTVNESRLIIWDEREGGGQGSAEDVVRLTGRYAGKLEILNPEIIDT